MRPSPALRLELLAVLVLVAAAQASAQVVVAIEANPGIAKPGEQLEIRVTVSNQGAGAVAGVSLNLVVPAELDPFLNSVPTPAFSGCSQVVNNSLCEPGETISWNLGTINARQSVTTSLTPIVAAGAIGPILFNPTASTGGSASATVTVNAARTLDVSVHEGGDPVAAGDDLHLLRPFVRLAAKRQGRVRLNRVRARTQVDVDGAIDLRDDSPRHCGRRIVADQERVARHRRHRSIAVDERHFDMEDARRLAGRRRSGDQQEPGENHRAPRPHDLESLRRNRHQLDSASVSSRPSDVFMAGCALGAS